MKLRKTEEQLIGIFKETGAILFGHFVYTSGKHGGVYVNKDAIYPYPSIHKLCKALVMGLPYEIVQRCEVIVAPALGGIVLSRLASDYFWEFWEVECPAVYAEKTTDGQFEFRRDYDKIIAGRDVLIVEDIMTTGGSVCRVRDAAERVGAKVIGAAVLWNRGGITAEKIRLPHLSSLISQQFPSWNEKDCELCKTGVPVNTDVGKGRDFLTRKAMEGITKVSGMAVTEDLGEKKK